MDATERPWRLLRRLVPPSVRSALHTGPTALVLTYHAVGGDGYDAISTAHFRRDVRFLTDAFHVTDLASLWSEPPETGLEVALTFDDGYRSFFDEVVPVLREFDAPATVFVVSQTLEDDDFVHDAELSPAPSYMTASELASLADSELVTVGNHTRSHPRLSALDDERVVTEIRGAQETLEAHLGVSVDRFSYPHGDYDQCSLATVRESHDYGVTVEPGSVADAPDRYRIPRLNGAIAAPVLRYELQRVADRLSSSVPPI